MMSSRSARRTLLTLACLLCAVDGRPALAADARGFVCYANADGTGWVCGADAEVRPIRSQPKAATREAAPDRRIDEAPAPRSVTPAATAAAVTSVTDDPSTWYVEAPARDVLPSHAMHPDLAAGLYRVPADDRGGYCVGRYEQRDYPHPADVANEEHPIVAEADGLTALLDESFELKGNVTIEQGNRRLVAPGAHIEDATRIATFPEGVRMDQPGVVMQGAAATIELNNDKAHLSDAQFILLDANIRGRAEALYQAPNGDLTLTDNTFTRCEPGNNGWRLKTNSLLVEEDEVFATARGAVLRLKSVPVFYTPYLKFPVSDERVSGFLFPNLSYSDEDGVDVSIPYYLNLAPNYDATVIPRYMGERGAGGELEFRHRSSWQETSLSGALLPDDDRYNGTFDIDDFEELGGEPMFGEFDPADRWLGAVDHRGYFGDFATLIDYTSVSDRDYFRDLGSDLGVSSRVELQRRGQIQYNNGGLYARLWAQRFQRLDSRQIDDYERLPELEVLYNTAIAGPLEFSLGAKWADFDRDTEGLNGLNAITGSRAHVEPRLRLPFSWPFGFLTFTSGYRYTSYDLEQDPGAAGLQLLDDSPDRGIGMGSVDGGLFFERGTNLFGREMIQTLEPRLYYLWQAFDEQDSLPRFDTSRLTFGYSQLFRSNRFAGLDRIGDANQLSAGVTTRFLSRANGEEYFRFSVGEIVYFTDRRVTLNGIETPDDSDASSALAAEFSARLARRWRLGGDIVWDHHNSEVDEGAVRIQYRGDNRHIFNVGYRRLVQEDIDQTDLSLTWPITKHFSLVGRWNYDLVSGRTIEGFGGIEYNDCCLKVRLMARHFLDSPTGRDFDDVESDDGVFLQIVFKGLAGFGTKVESILERGVRGYRSPEPQSYFKN